LHAFIAEAVEPGSRVHTAGWEGYVGLKAKVYQHRVTVLETSKRSPVEVLPRVHLVASLLKRWLLGTLSFAKTRPLRYVSSSPHGACQPGSSGMKTQD
jgi:hypothetical protein